MAHDSSIGFSQGYHTFLYGYKWYNRGSGRKRKNEQYGLSSAPSARRVVLSHIFVQLFVHFIVYLRRIFFAKLLQKPLGMPTYLWPSSSLLPSADRCPLHLCVSLHQLTLSVFLCQLTLSGFLCQLPLWLLSDLASPHFRLVRDLESKPFVWFRAKTDKGIVCLADHPLSVTSGPLKVVNKFTYFSNQKWHQYTTSKGMGCY